MAILFYWVFILGRFPVTIIPVVHARRYPALDSGDRQIIPLNVPSANTPILRGAFHLHKLLHVHHNPFCSFPSSCVVSSRECSLGPGIHISPSGSPSCDEVAGSRMGRPAGSGPFYPRSDRSGGPVLGEMGQAQMRRVLGWPHGAGPLDTRADRSAVCRDRIGAPDRSGPGRSQARAG